MLRSLIQYPIYACFCNYCICRSPLPFIVFWLWMENGQLSILVSLRRYLMTRAQQVDKIYNWWCAQISVCKHNRPGCFIEQATSSTQFSGLVWHVWTPSVSFCWQPRIPVSNIHWPSFWFLACNLCAVCKPPVAQHESGATFHRCDENGGWPRQCFFEEHTPVKTHGTSRMRLEDEIAGANYNFEISITFNDGIWKNKTWFP